MTIDEALELVNRELAIDAVETHTGKEIKCWICDGEGGRSKAYLSSLDCERLAEAFTTLGASLAGSTPT